MAALANMVVAVVNSEWGGGSRRVCGAAGCFHMRANVECVTLRVNHGHQIEVHIIELQVADHPTR